MLAEASSAQVGMPIVIVFQHSEAIFPQATLQSDLPREGARPATPEILLEIIGMTEKGKKDA